MRYIKRTVCQFVEFSFLYLFLNWPRDVLEITRMLCQFVYSKTNLKRNVEW
jgi:hypothetical protein